MVQQAKHVYLTLFRGKLGLVDFHNQIFRTFFPVVPSYLAKRAQQASVRAGYRNDGGSDHHEIGRTKMALNITHCVVGGVAVLAVEGRIVLGEETLRAE